MYTMSGPQAGPPPTFFLLLQYRMDERRCHKCGKDFSGDGHWKQSLRRHLERKFPCDLQRPQEPSRTPSRSLSTIEWNGSDVPQGKSMRSVTGWFFKEIVKDPANVCFVRPNMNKDEYWVRVSPGDVVRVNQTEFIRLWVNHVLVRCFPKGTSSYDWEIQADAGIEIDRTDWNGVTDPSSDFVFEMRARLKEFMDFCPVKKQIKNELVKCP
jgi:hypothetical protein